MSALSGKWTLEKTENFDEYMCALGVGWMLRKIGNQLKPMQEIVNTGDKWQIHTHSTFKHTHAEFEIGKEFDETTADGRQVKTTATLDGEKLVMEQLGDPVSTITRELVDTDTMLMTLTAKDVTCRRHYSRQKGENE